jgi:hypothetical protein
MEEPSKPDRTAKVRGFYIVLLFIFVIVAGFVSGRCLYLTRMASKGMQRIEKVYSTESSYEDDVYWEDLLEEQESTIYEYHVE